MTCLTRSLCTWIPSAMISQCMSGSKTTVPATPGFLWSIPLIALNRCVAWLMPRLFPCMACSYVALVWPISRTMPLSFATGVIFSMPSSSGATVMAITWPSPASTRRCRTSLSGRISDWGSWAPHLAGLRNGPSSLIPSILAPVSWPMALTMPRLSVFIFSSRPA